VRALAGAPVEQALPCELTLTGPGFSDTIVVPVIVGDSMNLPDGPTPCGLALFDHTDSTFAALPRYDWVELRSVGAPTGLGSDEAIQLRLPAEFGTWRWFGEEYDSLSICSNGFISAGWSDRVDFVNVQLPYRGAPPNIVAAVWDNLDPPSGGEVWYWHDTAGHRFIVEFDSVPCFAVPVEPEMVQVQVFDRTVPTPTGDNRVEIHFRTANYLQAATVGLQNHDGSEGMTHAWNGWGPRTAAPIVAGQALRLEGIPATTVGERPGTPSPRAALLAAPSVFTREVRFSADAARSGAVRLDVFSSDGRLVRRLTPGRNEWRWDGCDQAGRPVPAGVYIVALPGPGSLARVVFAGR
ncbi:hypothetical protein JXB37_03700, partial [candidate division WOR-3 bacterium]|nr:hypothetical protein [candidate division WOR-3 bacterium]